MEIKKDNFFVVQAFMINDLKLKGNDLLIYAIIYGFSQSENQYFTGSLNYLLAWTGISSKTTVLTILNNLVKKGLLEKEDIYKNGVKFCKYKAVTEIKSNLDINNEEVKNCNGISNSDIGISKIDIGYTNNCNRGISKIEPNNIINNIEDNRDNNIDIYTEIIEYLNLKADKKFRISDKTKKLIKARLNEKYNLDDFKLVIDNKCRNWLNTDMEKYLRPETLFGTKFESYLNEKVNNLKNINNSNNCNLIVDDNYLDQMKERYNIK